MEGLNENVSHGDNLLSGLISSAFNPFTWREKHSLITKVKEKTLRAQDKEMVEEKKGIKWPVIQRRISSQSALQLTPKS